MNVPEVESRLHRLIDEIAAQRSEIKSCFRDEADFDRQIALLREFVDVGEGGLAYESILLRCEFIPMKFSASAVLTFVELALHFGYKTTRDEDAKFDLTEHWLGGCTSNVFKTGPMQQRPQHGA